jgi:hypothetical protein
VTGEFVSDSARVSYGERFLQPNGEAIGSTNGLKRLAEEAIQLDRTIRQKAKTLRRDCAELGALLAKMRDLWRYLPNKKFRTFEQYVTGALGEPMSRSRVYELVTAHMLTEGENPIPAQEVEQMGIKRATEVARLRPEQRTPEIREMAKTEPVMAVRNKVQAVLNQELPPDEQKPMLKLLAINLPEETVQRFETLMEVMVYMEGIRDGDNTQTMRAKAFNAMLWSTEQYLAPELAQADKLRKASEGVYDSPAASAQEDFPEEEENEFPDDEQAQGRLYDEGTSTGSTDQREGNR